MDIYFYYIADDYIDFLKSVEKANRGYTCVPNTTYYSRKKFLFGMVFEMNGVNFYVPVSSKIKRSDNNIIMTSTKNKSVKFGSLRFQYMIPVPNKCLIPLEINTILEADRKHKIQDELR